MVLDDDDYRHKNFVPHPLVDLFYQAPKYKKKLQRSISLWE